MNKYYFELSNGNEVRYFIGTTDNISSKLDGEDSLSGIAKKDNTMILLEPRAYSES